ncbi:hypothetical protein JQ604_24505 [Bradyrhizobium jicamae]|uniref:hypothetical protein n=1 Tax=Bradyrhizobium jicamae TaxID=280332 RepID=UPI001BA46179|nr:hypothetical protein [Bradyrhizobium jicamae]MBR0755358.1 hypothetical protein [Bradyrhizobium jicamae]
MSELVYCCPRCFKVAGTGIFVEGVQTIENIQCRPILLKCKSCGNLISVAAKNMMMSSSLEGSRFAPMPTGQFSDHQVKA